MDKKELVIVGGGQIDCQLLSQFYNESKEIVGVDGGCDIIVELGIHPKMIMGDMDSISSQNFLKLKQEGVDYLKFPPVKDETDMELAIQWGINKAYDKIILLGASGSRIDHSLANIILLSKYKDYPIEILDQNNRVYIRNSSFYLKKDELYGDFISFFAFPNEVQNLSLVGFKYPLDNYFLKVEDQLCISNELIQDQGYVNFEGSLIVMETKD